MFLSRGKKEGKGPARATQVLFTGAIKKKPPPIKKGSWGRAIEEPEVPDGRMLRI